MHVTFRGVFAEYVGYTCKPYDNSQWYKSNLAQVPLPELKQIAIFHPLTLNTGGTRPVVHPLHDTPSCVIAGVFCEFLAGPAGVLLLRCSQQQFNVGCLFYWWCCCLEQRRGKFLLSTTLSLPWDKLWVQRRPFHAILRCLLHLPIVFFLRRCEFLADIASFSGSGMNIFVPSIQTRFIHSHVVIQRLYSGAPDFLDAMKLLSRNACHCIGTLRRYLSVGFLNWWDLLTSGEGFEWVRSSLS